MEIAQLKTRARTALAMEVSATTSPKRRKMVQLKSLSINNNTTTVPAAEEGFSGESPASCCSSNESFDENQIIKFSDLEVESAQVETSTYNCGEPQQIRSEMSLSNELRLTNSQEEEHSTMHNKSKSRCVLSPPQKMPMESELEEFFTAAEKDIQKRFSDKYNYDIVKDVPLEGRYEWVKLKP